MAIVHYLKHDKKCPIEYLLMINLSLYLITKLNR